MKSTWFNSGQWNAVCDVCGFYFKNTQLQKRWDGLMVCKEDWEVRHPQELIRPIPDSVAPPWTRPVGGTEFIVVPNNAPQTCGVFGAYSNADFGEANCMVVGNNLTGLL